MNRNGQALRMGVLFESGLGFAGLGLAWIFSIPLVDRLQPTVADVQRGIVATLPMFVMLGLIIASSWPPLTEIKRHVERLARELFATATVWDIALISLAAGLGEEILFRGALQPWIASWTNPWIALSVVSLAFGLAHAMSTAYFVVATLIGAYFGWLAMEYDDLVAPIVAHSVYDFVAIVVVRQRSRSS